MFRENWRQSAFWLWWWRERISLRTRVLGGSALAVVVLVGGYAASGGLTGASASDTAGSYVIQTTVTRVVTLKGNGRAVVRRIPVVIRRTVSRPGTAHETVVETRVVTAGGENRVVRTVARYVPVTRTTLVTLHGKTSTVTETRLVPTVQTETLTNLVTNEQTVTAPTTVVVRTTSTATVTRPVTTVETHTVTLPVTVTNSETETHTVVSTAVETVTVTAPVTTTVTLPG